MVIEADVFVEPAVEVVGLRIGAIPVVGADDRFELLLESLGLGRVAAPEPVAVKLGSPLAQVKRRLVEDGERQL